tara:strand:+ start:3126 stop:3407 length:282 start_codon:yes stop_codon:yes gene_type:complete
MLLHRATAPCAGYPTFIVHHHLLCKVKRSSERASNVNNNNDNSNPNNHNTQPIDRQTLFKRLEDRPNLVINKFPNKHVHGIDVGDGKTNKNFG